MSERQHPAHPLLLVDDEAAWVRSFATALRYVGLNNLLFCHDPDDVIPLLERQPVEMVLLDVTMPKLSGDRLLEQIRRLHPEIPVVMLTASDEVDLAVRCMQLGAANYLLKSTHQSQLVALVHQTLSLRNLQRVNSHLEQVLFTSCVRNPEAFSGFITADRAMHLLFQYLEAIAESPEPLLITGETGTGKELVARALHTLSRRPGALVAVNVAGLDDDAFSDTLFGHLRGAFTGALDRRGGLIERAEGGTLFLDEIGDLSPNSQVKLLRLLQEGEYLPLGSDAPRRCDVRVVTATHRDLSARLREGGFRKDLYFRLRTHHVNVPPLRERTGDIPLLADFFLDEACATRNRARPDISAEALERLNEYSFPGNVRELRALMHDAVGRMNGEVLSSELFQDLLRDAPARIGLVPPDLYRNLPILPTLRQAQQMLLVEALRRTNQNQAAAAHLLGITRQAINQRLNRSRPPL